MSARSHVAGHCAISFREINDISSYHIYEDVYSLERGHSELLKGRQINAVNYVPSWMLMDDPWQVKTTNANNGVLPRKGSATLEAVQIRKKNIFGVRSLRSYEHGG